MLPPLTTSLTFGAFIRRSDQERRTRIPTRALSLLCFLQSPVRAQLVHNGWKLFSNSCQNLVHWQTKVCGYLLDLLIAQRCLKLVSSDRHFCRHQAKKILAVQDPIAGAYPTSPAYSQGSSSQAPPTKRAGRAAASACPASPFKAPPRLSKSPMGYLQFYGIT